MSQQRRGALEVRGLWPFLSLPLPHDPPSVWPGLTCLWRRTISVLSWGWLVLPTSAVGQPLWKETLPQTLSWTTVFPSRWRSGGKGSVERVGSPKSGCKMAGPTGTCLGGLVQAESRPSHPAPTMCWTLCQELEMLQ